MFKGLTKRAQKILALIAQEEAKRFHADQLLPEHIILALLKEGTGQALRILKKLGIEPVQLQVEIENNIFKNKGGFLLGDVPLSKRGRKILEDSAEEARKFNHEYIGTEHLLLASAKEPGSIISMFLASRGITTEILRDTVAEMSEISKSDSKLSKQIAVSKKIIPGAGGKNTPLLNEFSRDLTELALSGQLDPVVGREKEINRVIQIMARRTKNNPILLGEPGVGKTAIVEGLATRIALRKAPDILHDKRLMILDLASVIAGTKYRGEFEERLKRIMKEIKSAGDIILFIDEIHTIVGAGGAEGAIDASNMLKPALSRGEIQCIGATTLSEYRKNIEKDSALERRFQPVLIEEPTADETKDILNGVKKYYEEFHNVTYTEQAVNVITKLASRYLTDRLLPDKAIDILDEAGSRKRIATSEKPEELDNINKQIDDLNFEKKNYVNNQDYEKAASIRDMINTLREQKEGVESTWKKTLRLEHNLIDENDIYQVLAEITGIPVARIAENESEKLLKIEDHLHKSVIGQEEAITAVSSAIRRRRAGISSHARPLGSFIFLGPTGVGKTLLAKTLAEFMFGTPEALVRIDMSDYMEKHNSSRLVGSPPGYIGYDEGGVLTEKVRRKPYCVILFDEIEKAHPDVFNLLLQILEEGEIQDNLGHRVSFRNAVIIMTSNAGARDISTGFSLGFRQNTDISYSEIKSSALNELKRIFRPEFLNRVDEIVVFQSLNRDEMHHIFDNMINELKERLSEKRLEIVVTEEAKNYLIEKGWDTRFGARPLRRVIQKEVEDILSTMIISGILDDNSRAVVDFKNDKINIHKE
ncbi:MAG: ATP-dependent Clp protease ATP-binding subunit [Spirochaetia bacterium]|jgi:ATP-dependent Clp protease ATP-binding subunit ClpC|nr:ATP-dependent Clp protease ATP-binding subunit [Spirochaetia bacterium]